jgi:hypothetical protein
MNKPKKEWKIYLRFHNQIRQIHLSSRQLSEAEIISVPDHAWVDEYYMDKNWSFGSWLKQYEKQSDLLSQQAEEIKIECEMCPKVCIVKPGLRKKGKWIEGSIQSGRSKKYPGQVATFCSDEHAKKFLKLESLQGGK